MRWFGCIKPAFPYTTRSAAMGWPHAGDHLPRTVLRSVYRNRSYSIGTGYCKHVPDGFYLQHSTFGIAWSSKDPVAYFQCGHPYWRSDRDNPGGWQLAPTSPFMQTGHHENTAIALFHIPQADPWPAGCRPFRLDSLPRRSSAKPGQGCVCAAAQIPRSTRSLAGGRDE